MKLLYTVSKDKFSNLWYAHKIGFANIPVMVSGRPTFGTKKNALNNAAIMQYLPYSEYMILRKNYKI